MKQSFPLQWPEGWSRTPSYQRKAGPNQMPAGRVRQLLMNELKLLGATDVVLSTDISVRRDGLPYAGQAAPKDPGVVLYFTRKGQDISLPCDRWRTMEANLRAIGLTVEAMRGIERWGTEQMVDRTFTGYAELPATATAIIPPRAWYDVLQVHPDADPGIIKAVWRRLIARYHPDNQVTGDAQSFAEVQAAYEESQR